MNHRTFFSTTRFPSITFILLLLCVSAGAAEPEIFPYICSDGEIYSAWVNPKGRTRRFDQPDEHALVGFCKGSIFNQSILDGLNPSEPGSARQAIACLKDESDGTMNCLSEFRKRNMRGDNVTSSLTQFKNNPPKDWFDSVLTLYANDLKAENCSQTGNGNQLKAFYEETDFGGMTPGRGCFGLINKLLLELSVSKGLHRKSGSAVK